MVLLTLVADKHHMWYLLEHPETPEGQKPSWWNTDQAASLQTLTKANLITFDACMLGQWTAKGTTVLTNLIDLAFENLLKTNPGRINFKAISIVAVAMIVVVAVVIVVVQPGAFLQPAKEPQARLTMEKKSFVIRAERLFVFSDNYPQS